SMGSLIHDLRVSLRSLRKRPGFTVVVVLTLALGIGAPTAIFSLVSGVLLRPLPYQDPDRVVLVWEKPPGGDRFAVAPANFLDWREQNEVFEDMAASAGATVNLTGTDEPERIRGRRVSASFFPILGVPPALGRTFLPEEDQPEGERVVVLSHGLWQRRFGSEPSLVGQAVSLDGVSYTVIGVMPRGFQDLTDIYSTEETKLWLPYPFANDPPTERGAKRLRVVARLKPDVSLARAQEDMDLIVQRLVEAYPEAFWQPPDSDENWGARVALLQRELMEQVRGSLLVLLGAVGFVLLIACVNVANLFLVRAAERQREIAIRASLGADRGRLVWHMLKESVFLTLLGGAGGLLLARWAVSLLVALNPADVPRLEEVGIDAPVLGFTLLISIVTVLAVGVTPALQAFKPTLTESLKEGEVRTGAGRGRRRGREVLVVAEIALALVLLIGAGLMLNTMRRLQAVDLGFSPDNVLLTRVYLPRSKYAEATGVGTTPSTERFTRWTVRPEHTAFVQDVLRRMNALPEVESAAAVNYPPASGQGWGLGFSIEGHDPPASPEDWIGAYVKTITPGYLRTMGIPVRRGRAFTEQDRAGGSEVAIINEAAAQQYWHEENPIGTRVRMQDSAEDDERSFEIVGVVGDVKQAGLDADPEAILYMPYFQQAEVWVDWQVGFLMGLYFVARTRDDPQSLAPAMRRAVWDVDPDQPIRESLTMNQLVAESLSNRRFYALLLGSFAGVALILAAMGIYGVMSYSVSQRTHEIGVRMAMGAERGGVLRQVITRGLLLAVVGVALGIAASLGLTRFISSQLYGVSTTDPVTFTGISLLLIGVALAACYIPARKAATVDPLVALRHE
ncbi:ABC transporter permease, partial [Gemmatimonadota bacterium]